MADRVIPLDALCAVLADVFHATNAGLAREPLPDPGAPVPAFPYRVERETKYALRTIPYSELQRMQRYQLADLAFSVPCCVSTRRTGTARQTVLSLQAPAWWTRAGRPLVCKRMHIDLHAQTIALRFSPAERAELPRNGERWILLLTPAQQQALAASPASSASSDGAAVEGAPQSSRPALHRRFAQWLRRKRVNDVR